MKSFGTFLGYFGTDFSVLLTIHCCLVIACRRLLGVIIRCPWKYRENFGNFSLSWKRWLIKISKNPHLPGIWKRAKIWQRIVNKKMKAMKTRMLIFVFLLGITDLFAQTLYVPGTIVKGKNASYHCSIEYNIFCK